MNLPHNFDEHVKSIARLAGAKDKSLRESMLNMSERDFNQLRWSLPYVRAFLRDFEATAKAAYVERYNNYPNMVKQAKKRFSEVDVAILEFLIGADDSLAYYTANLVHRVRESLEAPITEQVVKNSIRLLKRRGLIELVSGLFDEDGYTAGSGYMVVYHKRDVIADIITSYRTLNAKLDLDRS